MIEYGDSRAPEGFWERVHVVPEMACWVWTGSIKKDRDNPLAVYHARHSNCSTVLVYMAVTFHGMERGKQKALRECGNGDCANPNHVQVMLKGQCVVDSKHGVNRYTNGQCVECRRVKDQGIPNEVINERARKRRANLRSGGGTVVSKTRTRPTTNKDGVKLSVFGDVKPDKVWRPAGWSEEVKVFA